MVNSGVFNYADVLNKAADASWLRQTAITNNIANVDTPGYKRQDVDFESVLERELRHFQYETLDEKVAGVNNGHMKHLEVNTYTDAENYSYRIDKNNVDIDQESSELAANQIKYQGLTYSMSQEFTRTKTVIG